MDRLIIIAAEGVRQPANLSDLKGQYAGDELAVINAENDLYAGRLALTQLLIIPCDAGLTIERNGFDNSIKMYDACPLKYTLLPQGHSAAAKASGVETLRGREGRERNNSGTTFI